MRIYPTMDTEMVSAKTNNTDPQITQMDADFNHECGLRMYCEGCGCVRYFINCRVEGLDEIYTCSVCYMEKRFRVR